MSQAKPVSPRKVVADHVLARVLEGAPEGMVVKPSATNPYAFCVEVGGKSFRVIVKEQE
jgi:hypothetical protein